MVNKVELGYEVVLLSSDRIPEVEQLVVNTWSSPKVVVQLKLYDLRDVPAFIAVNTDNEIIGHCHFKFFDDVCEIMLIESLRPGIGVGTALVDAVINLARDKDCSKVHLQSSNDNTNALRFYQRRGFAMCAVGWNHMVYARELKPEIPLTGKDGITLLHSIEFELML